MVDGGEIHVEGDVGWEERARGGREERAKEGSGEVGVDERGFGMDVGGIGEQSRECYLGVVGA